ncbi:MAG TPA: hypothetical protein VGA30_08145 [Actinomycetota bacterium]
MKRIPLFLLVLVLLASGCGHRSDLGASGSGVRGRVTLGPTCPVERVGSPCPDHPVQAVVIALRRIGDAVGNVRTDARGEFFLPLAPGTYLIYARELSGDNPRISKFQRVTVTDGSAATVALVIDSGIR